MVWRVAFEDASGRLVESRLVPVLIDVPKNIQQQTTQPIFPAEVKLRGYNPIRHADDVALNELMGLIEQAKT